MKMILEDNSEIYYECEPCINNLSKERKEELVKIYLKIVALLGKYCFPIDSEALQKFDMAFLKVQEKGRKNVDEGILEIIKKNQDILFIKVGDPPKPLWKFLEGYEVKKTFLPKTVSYILMHPTASLVPNYDGKVFPYFMLDNNLVLDLVLKNENLRKWTFRIENYTIGAGYLQMIRDYIGNKCSVRDDINADCIDYLLSNLEKIIECRECSITKDCFGSNLGHNCALLALDVLDDCYYLKNYSKRYPKIKDGELCIRFPLEKIKIFYKLALALKEMISKFITLYPNEAQNVYNVNGVSVIELYSIIIESLAKGMSYRGIIQAEKERAEQEKRAAELESLIPTTENIALELSL